MCWLKETETTIHLLPQSKTLSHSGLKVIHHSFITTRFRVFRIKHITWILCAKKERELQVLQSEDATTIIIIF